MDCRLFSLWRQTNGAGTWNIVTNSSYGILVDAALSNAVARIGAHYPGGTSPAAAQTCGKVLWSSEDGIGGSTWAAASKLGQIFNSNYITGKMTATEIWSPITSYYDILPASDSGLMRANTPWSGNYFAAPAIWVMAHTTQFAFPGWSYLEGGASELLPGGGSIVALLSTNGADYSAVIETFAATSAANDYFPPDQWHFQGCGEYLANEPDQPVYSSRADESSEWVLCRTLSSRDAFIP